MSAKKSFVEKAFGKLTNALMNKTTNIAANKAIEAVGLGRKTTKKIMPHELQGIIDGMDFALDTLNGRSYWNGKVITEIDYSRLRNDLCSTYGVKFPEGDIKRAVLLSSHNRPFNPVQKYLAGLPKWDRVDRIPALFDLMRLKVDDEAHRQLMERVLLAFLTSCVARVEQPGVKADSMLILRGPTAYRKSSFLRALAVNDEWFSDAELDLGNKDAMQTIGRFWLFECAELHNWLKRPPNEVKSFVSRQRDDYRAPYARIVESHERQVVFVGSTNQERFLTDPTSTRRFWVGEVSDRIDVDALIAMRDALWSQAYIQYQAGAKHFLNPADEDAMAKKMARYQVGETKPVGEAVVEAQ